MESNRMILQDMVVEQKEQLLYWEMLGLLLEVYGVFLSLLYLEDYFRHLRLPAAILYELSGEQSRKGSTYS